MHAQRIIDHVAFDAPAGLEDATRYAFGDETGPEALTVELEAPAGTATPGPEVIADLRDSISAVFPFGEILDEGETLLDGRRAWFLAYEVGPEGSRAVGMVVVANLPQGDYVKLHLRVGERAELGPRFGPTLASVSLRGGEAPQPAGPGYRRERVGPVALDVPQAFAGPRARLYTDADDRLRLRITVRPLGATAATLEDAIAGDARGGELLEREDRSWSWGWWARHRQRGIDPPHRERAIVRAGLTVTAPDGGQGQAPQSAPPGLPSEPGVQQVEIHGTAEPERAADLHAAFDALISSIRWQERRSSTPPPDQPLGPRGEVSQP